MGSILNPSNMGFQESLNSRIYVDKSGLISVLNGVIRTEEKYVCVSRPRRFGKTMAAKMLAAYYSLGSDSRKIFSGLEIAADPLFETHINKYNVLALNMQQFLSPAKTVDGLIEFLRQRVLRELFLNYPDIQYFNKESLTESLDDLYFSTGIPFVIIIDEWDCIFREYKSDVNSQKIYLDFLRTFLKDREYIALTYMTGILPIKKYGTNSALNMFNEYSMTDPSPMARFTGFTSDEVKNLYLEYQIDSDEMAYWYDGYRLPGETSVYNPRSVVAALSRRSFGNYWTRTETCEALRIYIELNIDGLKDEIPITRRPRYHTRSL